MLDGYLILTLKKMSNGTKRQVTVAPIRKDLQLNLANYQDVKLQHWNNFSILSDNDKCKIDLILQTTYTE